MAALNAVVSRLVSPLFGGAMTASSHQHQHGVDRRDDNVDDVDPERDNDDKSATKKSSFKDKLVEKRLNFEQQHSSSRSEPVQQEQAHEMQDLLGSEPEMGSNHREMDHHRRQHRRRHPTASGGGGGENDTNSNNGAAFVGQQNNVTELATSERRRREVASRNGVWHEEGELEKAKSEAHSEIDDDDDGEDSEIATTTRRLVTTTRENRRRNRREGEEEEDVEEEGDVLLLVNSGSGKNRRFNNNNNKRNSKQSTPMSARESAAPKKNKNPVGDFMQSSRSLMQLAGNKSHNKSQISMNYYEASLPATPQPLGRDVKRAISETMLSFDPNMQFAENKSFQVKWQNLNFSYERSLLKTMINLTVNRNDDQRRDEQILKNLSGRMESNKLVAIVGPSGCGKTTFLQLLGGNVRTQSGRLTIEGLDAPRVSFIGQGDSLLNDLTCRETLIYSSRLQNTCPNFDHASHIEPVLQALGLSECAHRPVQKLSGGQLKRVSIAQELLYPTNLLILDEITSGLDASTSYSIIKQLKRLTSDTSYPMTIVISIHQPSARLFSVFDQVYVMSKGRCLYDGPTKIDAINAHLRNFNLECPKFTNIADYLIEIASDDLHTNEIREQMFRYHEQLKQDEAIGLPRDRSKVLADQDRLVIMNNKSPDQTTIQITTDSATTSEDDGAMSTTSTCSSTVAEINNGAGHQQQQQQAPPPLYKSQQQQSVDLESTSGYILFEAIERARGRRKRPFWAHFMVHFERSSARLRRSYIFTYMQLLTYVVLGLQLTTFFGPDIGKLSGCPQLPMSFISYVLSSEDDDSISLEMRRIQENINFMLVVVMTTTFAALEITVITFPLEAKTVKREWRNGRYRVSSYFIGRTMADLPIQVFCVFLFSLLTFSQTGQYGLYTWRFLCYWLILTCCGLAAQTVGFLFGAIFMDSLPLAVFSAPLSIFPALLFSGFFARVNTFSPVYQIMSRVSHFRYAFEALIVTLYGHNRCSCDQQALTQYHQSLESQTNTMRDMFKTMLGVTGCPQQPSPNPYADGNSNGVEDTTGFSGDIDSFVAKDLATTTIPPASLLNLNSSSMINALMSSTTTTTTERPMKAFEDALVDSVYAHMNTTTSGDSSNGSSSSAVDMVMSRFTTKITQMFNSRSNFGRPVPKECSKFSSYLISEFELNDHDLIQGIIVLFFVVIFTRMICNYLLTLTMRTKIS